MNSCKTVAMIVYSTRRCWLTGLVLVALAGCHKPVPSGRPIEVEPSVQLVHPQRRDLHHEVGQPGYVYAYEQTSLYPKVAGFIEQWLVDIGDLVKKGQLLANIYVPELEARYQEKKARVELAEEHVKVAQRMVEVAQGNVEVAEADVRQARSDIDKYQADVERWQSEVKRLTDLADQRVVNTQVVEESRRQLKLAHASRSSAEAALLAAQAREKARKADLEKAKVDVKAAQAQVKVDNAAEEHLAALVSYTHMHAPYDGIVIIRNANTGDYVEPRYGDESAQVGGTETTTPTRGTPIYIVARSDVVRVYVDVPEMQANYVDRGTKARVRIQALDDEEVEGTVTRTSWALNVRTRTLRAEIDLPNKGARLRPGMYAYGLVEIDRRNVWTLPVSAVVEIGNDNTCYLYEDGKAIATPVQTGINDGKRLEVFRKKVHGEWTAWTGDEEVIVGDLAELRDGEKVRVAHGKGEKNETEDQGQQKKSKRGEQKKVKQQESQQEKR
jgi:HlyD family secretion protein